MKCIYFDGKTPALRKDFEKPVPRADEMLVRVSLAGICNTDLEIAKGYMDFEGVMGHEFVGIVEEGLLRGTRVVGEINLPCGNATGTCQACREGLGNHCPERTVLGIKGRNGCFAEYITLPEANLHAVPDCITDREAVFVEPLAAAFRILEQVEIGEDDRVAVFGDGKLGLLTAQVLALSDCELHMVGKHQGRMDILKRMELTKSITPHLAGDFTESVDIAVDCTGSPDGFRQALDSVRPRGTLVVKSTFASEMEFNPSRIVVDEITVVGSRCGPFEKALEALESGLVEVEPLIVQTYTLEKYKHAFKAAQTGLKVLIEM